MYISSLQIRNYRNFKASSLDFKKGVNTIIGENASGKTNLFQAIRLLIDDSLPRYIKLSQSDFCRALDKWEGHWIIISIEFDGLDNSDESQALAIHATGQVEHESKGKYSLYFRPKIHIRKNLYTLSLNPDKSVETLNNILNSITIDDYETILTYKGSGDFSNDEDYKSYVGDFREIKFPDPDNLKTDVFGVRPTREMNILDHISCTFIKALRDVESDLKSYANNPLINLLKDKEKLVDKVKLGEITETITKLNGEISTLSEITSLETGIDNLIKKSVGTTYAPNININAELPSEVSKLFQSLRLWVGDPDESGYKGKIWELSLGGANIIFFALKLMEYQNIRNDRVANFLLIEEPEAHIHTHIQKALFKNLGESKTQIILSTHSTHISSVSKVSSVNILSRNDRKTDVFNPSKGLEPEKITKLERYLDAVRSTLLFAKGVILVEGDAENILIPELFRVNYGLSLDEIGISIINVGSTGFENIAQIFHKDRVSRHCAIITDQDISVISLPDDVNADTPEQKKSRASQKSGAERKVILDRYILENNCIKAFYAKHTFEIDLFLSDNKELFKNSINSVYTQAAKRTQISSNLDSPEKEISASAALEIASYEGKGWFAILLAELITPNTRIPDYILHAIAFSASHITQETLRTMVKSRIKILSSLSEHNDAKAQIYENIESAENIVEAFRTNLSNDSLSTFFSKIS